MVGWWVSGCYGVRLERFVRCGLEDDDSDMVDCCECGSVRISIDTIVTI